MSAAHSTSTELIKTLGLEEHIEGGYFTVTDVQEEKIPSAFAGGEKRQLATSIYYLLSYDRPVGTFHMNKSVTYHVWHQGRAEYTLITPGNPPRIERKVIGPDASAGETRMLLVGTGVWKRSALLEVDMQAAESEEEREKINCLITEVVVPGFDWKDHRWMRREDLEGLFEGVLGGEEKVREFEKWVFSGSEEEMKEKVEGGR
ncbi:hypothetical protein JR316_0011492 [Psilocybe cubensis]|uniref:DUF985 domain-containing protein n=2 Tax=Psilocybe cubensis TaxID=181762 RepID=A0A8H7XUD5_PSICU|nr:hypothetical protein JR316_0011492 [Psilocybe cubensis]KAH9475930.1 hypothetical protein JR316_0011492 [Psilocybe cubensis]